jgi:hypothetical protein
MLEWQDGLYISSYVMFLTLVAGGLVWKVRRDKDLLAEFDSIFFLRKAMGWATLGTAGFIILFCALFWQRQSLAVGFTTLLGIPGWIFIAAGMQWGFYRRYNRIGNIIRRLEKLGPAQRQSILEKLPIKIFMQLPGDYRIVSWEENRR